jgi:hypothetical protein
MHGFFGRFFCSDKPFNTLICKALHGSAEYQFLLVSDKEFSQGATSKILLYSAATKL